MSESVAVAKLISALLLAIASYTGFTVPKVHPEIAFLAPGRAAASLLRAGPVPSMPSFLPVPPSIWSRAWMFSMTRPAKAFWSMS